MFVACPALLVARALGVKITYPAFPNPGLTVWFMTPDTVFIFLWIIDLPGSVDSLIQVVPDIVVAGKAFFLGEEVCPFLVDIAGIRVEVFLGNLFVAVQTGCLPVGRDMEFSGINQPGGLGLKSTEY